MTKTSILLLAGTALAGAAAYIVARSRRSLPQTNMQEPTKKGRHLNPVFSHLKQGTQQ